MTVSALDLETLHAITRADKLVLPLKIFREFRTAPARGLKYDTIGQMQREYSQECSENESEARARASQDRGDQKRQATEASNNAKLEKERASMREQQCGESKRILYAKRARTDLTEGEKADLRRFEETYRSRCT